MHVSPAPTEATPDDAMPVDGKPGSNKSDEPARMKSIPMQKSIKPEPKNDETSSPNDESQTRFVPRRTRTAKKSEPAKYQLRSYQSDETPPKETWKARNKE
jgi:hypothetical protein